MSFLHVLISFIIAISVLVAFHEFGHFIAARRLGVKVLRFSIGMGAPLWRYQERPESTEFVIAALPVGGYVRMVDEREGEVAPQDLPRAFNRRPLWVKSCIVAAGPLFNLALAVVLFWVLMMIGETGLKPRLDAVPAGSIAAAAGLEAGDEILQVEGRATPTWNLAISELFTHILDREVNLSIRTRTGELATRTLHWPVDAANDPESLRSRLGLSPQQPPIPPVIGGVERDGAAAAAGFVQGDHLVSAEGAAIVSWQSWVELVRSRPGQTIEVEVERRGRIESLTVRPEPVTEDGITIGRIGARVQEPPAELFADYEARYRLGFFPALGSALQKTGNYSWLTVKMIGRLVTGQIGVQNLSGPLSIAYYAGQSARLGFEQFLKFLAVISINLGILNLLPIPMLDGGHLLTYAVEGVRRRPLSEETLAFGQRVGMIILISLMMLALVMDLSRWVF